MKNLEAFAAAADRQDELMLCKREIEFLKKENDLRNREMEILKKENDELKDKVDNMSAKIEELLRREQQDGLDAPGDTEPVPAKKAI